MPLDQSAEIIKLKKQLKKEVAARKKTEKELRRSESDLRVRNRIAEIFLTIPDEEMYAEVLRVVLGVVGGKYGVFGYIDRNGNLVCPSLTRDVWDKCQMPDKDIVFSREGWTGIWGQALREKRSFCSNKPFVVPGGHIPITRTVAVPIIHQGDVIGLIQVANKDVDYIDSDQVLLESITDHIAPILNARLQRDIQEKECRLAENALRKAHDELELRVASRTVELAEANKKLQDDIVERKLAEKALQREHHTQRVVNNILSLSVETAPLDRILGLILEHIFSIPWLGLEERGCVFLVEEDPNVLVRKKALGLTEQQKTCNHIPFGKCLCGRAALTKEIQFADVVDQRHEIRYENIYPHGHYCVPIISSDNVLGVLNLFVKEGHVCNEEKFYFFNSIANVLAGVIKRKQVEDLLKRSETQYRTLVENVPDIILTVDCEGTIQFINQVVNGYNLREVRGTTIYDYILPEYHETVKTTLKKAFQSGENQSYEIAGLGSDGNNAWYITRIVPIKAAGQVSMAILIATDITGRKKALDDLKIFKLLCDNSSDAHFLLGRDARFKYVNQTACDMLGYSKEDLLKLSVPDVDVSYGIVKYRELFDLVQRKSISPIETINRRKNGTVFPSEITVTGHKLNGTAYMFAALRDVSERKQAESDLKLLRNLLDRTNDAVVVADASSGKYVYVNNKACVTRGYTREEHLSLNVLDVVAVPAGMGHSFWRRHLNEIREKGNMTYEILHKRKDGSTFPVEVSVNYIAHENKEYLVSISRDISERKRAEKNLELVRTILNHSNDAILLVDPVDGRFLDFNEKACDILGYKRAELKAMTVLDVSGNFLRDGYSWEDCINEFRAKEGIIFEADYKRKDGIKFPGEVSARCVILGGKDYLITAVRDISARKQAEQALHESEERFRDMALISSDWLWETDSTGCYTYCSEQVKNVLGYEAGEILGKTVFELMCPDEAARAGKVVKKLVKARQPIVDLENWNISRDGTEVCLLTNSVPMYDREGVFVGYRGVDKDITERKRAEKSLRESEELFRTVFEFGGLGIALVSQQGKPTYFNPMIQSLLGYTPEELCGMLYSEFTYPGDLQKSHNFFKEINEGKRDWYQLEKRYIKKDGQLVWCRVTVSAVRDADKKLLYVIAVLENINERKEAEAKLRQTMLELERSNFELQQFVNVASHDLQEPLRMVTSFLQLLQRRYYGRIAPDANDFIMFAVDGAVRMRALIDALLEYSRVNTQGRKLVPTDCNAVFLQVLANLQTAIDESGAEITYDLLPTVMADSVQLVQLFQNLLKNAIKFQRVAPPLIHVSSELRDEEWVFSVKDNGIGIEPEYFNRIFEMFQRLHARNAYPGTGIGLAICKKIVERHGGRLWVESELAEGSTFYFTMSGIKGDSNGRQ